MEIYLWTTNKFLYRMMQIYFIKGIFKGNVFMKNIFCL